MQSSRMESTNGEYNRSKAEQKLKKAVESVYRSSSAKRIKSLIPITEEEAEERYKHGAVLKPKQHGTNISEPTNAPADPQQKDRYHVGPETPNVGSGGRQQADIDRKKYEAKKRARKNARRRLW